MNLVEKINDDVKQAMKSQDKEKLSVVRMVKSAVQLAKIELKHDLSGEEVIDVVAKQIKMRKDSIEEFTKAERNDLVEQYQREVEILNEYMPEQLSSEEVTKIIEEVFDKIKPTSPKQMGLIMKEITPKVKGKFDMGEISKIIKEKLNNL
ncbi:MAG: GatB/YqeY domain-containing protein [Erysipelotrichaceae bacterium]|nr:GatB/YqeY domain-containing protein [Erysipelotrichaceae bacterium]